MEIRINKEKNIGNVLFVVEGAKTEFSILKKIFVDILGYSYIEKRRGKESRYINQNNPNSCVAVINTANSNMTSISAEDGFLDTMFKRLVEEYKYPIDRAAIYFIFDRDPESNRDTETIKEYIQTLQNPYDNPNEIRAGQLLLNYPSVEAFTVSNFENDSWKIKVGLGKELKNYVSNHPYIQLNKISENTLEQATSEFYKYVRTFDENVDIDDFSDVSMRIFDFEETNYEETQTYNLFSMLTLAFLQLGIIEVD